MNLPALAPPAPPIRPFQLTPLDGRMLRALARYQFLTVEQWCRYFEDAGKRRYVTRRARELTEQEYLIRLPIGAHNAPLLFSHGRAGHRFVAWLGLPVPCHARHCELTSRSLEYLTHNQAITDVLLSFDLLARHDDRVAITEMRHQRLLTEQRWTVPVPFVSPQTDAVETRTLEVMPDAFVTLQVRVGTTSRTVPLLIDVDRDTQQGAFRWKVAKLVALTNSEPCEQLSGARPCTVACFVHAARRGPHERRADVLDWTERELRQRHREHEATMFRFCSLNPATVAPDELVLGDHWFQPFNATPGPLIDLSDGGATRSVIAPGQLGRFGRTTRTPGNTSC